MTNRLCVLNRTAQSARRISGKGYAAQLYEILALRFSRGMLDPQEYYFYGLYDDRRYSWSDKKQFMGQRAVENINGLMNAGEWRAVANDKLILHSILKGVGLPTPELFAVYRPGVGSLGAVPSFSDTESMREFLRSRIRYPFFAKPVDGAFGSGAFAVRSYDKTADQATLFNGDRASLEELSRIVESHSGTGYLFQDYIMPHPYIKKLCGECLSTVRFNIFLTAEGPSLFHCFWKIPTGRNMTDNFLNGQTGNILAAVNLGTGLVEAVRGGCGFDLTEHHIHPTTGERLVGITLPDWEEMKSLCLKTATMIPGLRLQHWDVAMSERGPVLMEVNAFGVFSCHQIAYRKGINDETFQRYLSLFGN